MTDSRYTFGDNDRASARLRRLAQLYEPETRALIGSSGVCRPRLAVDLGCGPGWSTRLLREILEPERTVGLDASEKYVAEARRNHGPDLEFALHDVTRAPFPPGAPDLLLCRFLLTHLSDLDRALAAFAAASAPGAVLLVHETERLESEHPAIQHYYRLLARMQGHYGQTVHVGEKLARAFARSPWRVTDSRALALEKPAAAMAELHLANLRTWREDPYAREAFPPAEIDGLEVDLDRVVRGVEPAGVVLNTVRHIVARVP